VYVGFVLDKVALGEDFLRVLKFSPVSITPPKHHAHSLIFHPYNTITATDSVLKQCTYRDLFNHLGALKWAITTCRVTISMGLHLFQTSLFLEIKTRDRKRNNVSTANSCLKLHPNCLHMAGNSKLPHKIKELYERFFIVKLM
jgi:hypothetical protein